MMISIKYGSHLPVLTQIVKKTNGPILELGVGLYSTPYLHWACFPTKRELTSYDNDDRWIRYFRDCRSDFHKVEVVTDWDRLEINQFWDVALVDHNPALRRKEEVKRLANFAKYIIVHDTEAETEKYHHYNEIYPLFKYRWDYTAAMPNTTVLSNFINQEQIAKLVLE